MNSKYKRNFDRLFVASKKDVNLKFLSNGILHYRLLVETNKDMEFKSLLVCAPEESSVGKFLQSQGFKDSVMSAIEEDLLKTPDPDNEEVTEKMDQWKDPNGLLTKNRSEEVFKRPPLEVMAMRQTHVETFFPEFIRTLRKREGLKGNKWGLEPPVKDWHNGIIDSKQFLGPNRSYAGGNISYRMKVMIYWLFLKNGLDPETFCDSKDPKYKPKNWTITDLENMGDVGALENFGHQE